MFFTRLFFRGCFPLNPTVIYLRDIPDFDLPSLNYLPGPYLIGIRPFAPFLAWRKLLDKPFIVSSLDTAIYPIKAQSFFGGVFVGNPKITDMFLMTG